MEDGRRSFRRVASQVGVTTPTVENRLRKMVDSGVIRKISPILDIDKVERGIAAFILLRVDLPRVSTVAGSLTPLEEVRNVFLSTGEANVILRVVTHTSEKLQDFLDSKIAPLEGAHLVSSQIVTRTLKDEQGIPLFEEMSIGLKCDYCGGDVSGKPFILDVGQGKRFFCCKTCLTSYKEKYGSRLRDLSAKRPEHPVHLT